MKLCEVIDLTAGQKKHPEIKYPKMLDKIDWGQNKGVETKDVIVRNNRTGTIYGRRAIVQRKT